MTRGGKRVILPSIEEVNREKEPGAPSSSDNDSVGSDFQGDLLWWQKREKEDQRWLDEHMTEDVDLDQHNAVIAETAEPPPDLIMPLLEYQKEFLAWGSKQEQSVAGGILADEMGMGKTIQAISLVLARREVDRAQSSEAVGGTLVVCPPVALSHWSNEITLSTSPGSTKVLIYHGKNREKNVEELMKCDFVLTTYLLLGKEFWGPPKVQCKYCSKSFDPEKLEIHLKKCCGPLAVKTEKQSKQKRNKSTASSSKQGKVKRSEEKTKKTVEEDQLGSVLHSIKWNRIILDEAHQIKKRRSNTAKAVFALEATYRWALTGTPTENQFKDINSLIRFLQIRPYSYHFCYFCNCTILDRDHFCGVDRGCPSCPHKIVEHFPWWKKYVARPEAAHAENSVKRKRALILHNHKVLKETLLRRTKLGCAAELALPPRIISLRRDALDIEEFDYYESLYKDSRAQFNTYIQAGTFLYNYAHIFVLLTRLRQAVDHPYLVKFSSSGGVNANLVDGNEPEQDCGLCDEPALDHIVTSCAHVFCKACLIGVSTSLGKYSCPTCSKLLTVDWTTKADTENQATVKGFRASSILNRIKLDDFQTSTKIEAMREEIRLMVERDGSAKAIVFSQFTSFLDLINYALGKPSGTAINKFKQDPDCRVFLISLKDGGVALNLTVASHVFMMDPWWIQAVERQAQDRIHRIGQYKPIRIVRFIIENTVEERILMLQKKKELLLEGRVRGSKEALGKLTEEDVRFLFE